MAENDITGGDLWAKTPQEHAAALRDKVNDFVGPKQPAEVPEVPGTWDMFEYRYARGMQNIVERNLLSSLKIATGGEFTRALEHKKREEQLQEEFPEEHQAYEAGAATGGALGTAAEFGGMILESPSTLISGGAAGKAAKAMGLGRATGVGANFAALGALDNLSYQYVDSSAINKKQVAMAAILGGAIPGIATKLGEKGAHRLVKDSDSPGDIHGAAKRQGVELTPEEIRKADDIIQGSDEGFKLAKERSVNLAPGVKQLDEMVAKFDDQPLNSFSDRVALKKGYNPVGDAWEAATPRTRTSITEASRTQKQQPTQGLKPPKSAEQAKQIVKELEESLARRKEVASLEKKIETEASLDVQQYQNISAYNQKMDKLLSDIDKVRRKEDQFLTKKDLQRSTAKQRISNLAAKYQRDEGTRIVTKEELRQGTTRRRGQGQAGVAAGRTTIQPAPDLTPQEVSKSLFAPEEVKNKIANTYKRLADAQPTRRVYLEDLRNELPDIPKKDFDDSLLNIQAEGKGALYPLSSPLERTEGRVKAGIQTEGADRHSVYLDTTKFPMDKQNAYKKAKQDLKDQRKFEAQNIKEAGEIDPRLLQTVAGVGVGGTAGLLIGEDPGDGVLGAILGGALPWARGKVVGKWKDKFRNPTPEGIGEAVKPQFSPNNVFMRVHKRLGRMGMAGKQLEQGMNKGYNNTILETSYARENIRQAAGKDSLGKIRVLTKAEKDLLPDILENKLPQVREKLSAMGMKEVPSHVRKVANQTRSELDKIVTRAVDTGIFKSREEAVKHYFPRITDEGYLASKAGQEDFVNTFKAIKWKEAGLRKTLSALLGEDRQFINRFMEHTKKKSDGTVMVDMGWIKELHRHRSNSPVARSAHIDMHRKIDLGEYDHLMDKFRVRDFDTVMNLYLREANQRIEYAKIFGSNDELAEQLMKQIGDDVQDSRAQDFAANAYYTEVGDATKSDILKSYYNMSDWVRGAQGSVRAFETWNLLMGQMLNPTQTMVNAPTYLSTQTNMFNALRHTVRGLVRASKNSPLDREFSNRAGAGLEAAIMGELSSAHREHTVFGRGPLMDKYMSKINSPTEFLKSTGFFMTEGFTQRWATLTGHSFIEDRLARLQEIRSGQLTDPKLIKEVQNGLAELGIDYNKAPDEIAVRDKHEAAMNFNRIINFTDGARQNPHVMRSPYAQLPMQYKTFSYRQGAFLNDTIGSGGKSIPSRAKALTTYLSAMGVAGMSVDEMRRMIRADDRDLTFTERYVRAVQTSGGFGLMMDTVLSDMGNEYRTLQGLIGPGPSDAFHLYGGAGRSISKSFEEGEVNIKPLSKAGYGALPSLPMQQEIKTMLFEELKNKKQKSDMWDLPLELKMELDLDI